MRMLKIELICWIIWKSQCSQSVESIWVFFSGSLQHQQVGLILIISGYKKFSKLEPDFYRKSFENNIEGQDIETYRTFVVTLDNTRLKFPMHNDSVTQNKKWEIARDHSDDEETTKDSE